jgi:uncharacterized membrane protein
MTLHSLFIEIHAASGIVAFVCGWACIHNLGTKPSLQLVWTFVIGLIGLDLFMIAAIINDIPALSKGQLYTFLGLTALGLYMLFRGFQAYSVYKKQKDNWRLPFIDHVGFGLISPFDGFVIVAAIDLKLPVWLVVIIGVLGVFVGVSMIKKVKSKNYVLKRNTT